MGNQIEPTDPEWKSCADGCLSLPDKLNCRVIDTPLGTREGQIQRMPLTPCYFLGQFWWNGYYSTVSVAFCNQPGNFTQVGYQRPVGTWFWENIMENHLYPYISVDPDPEIHIAVWP